MMSQHDFPLFSEFRVLLNTSKLTIIEVHVSDPMAIIHKIVGGVLYNRKCRAKHFPDF